ncbi:hypothetical protein [Paraburkholderia aspalathi]|uniref:hypothetical protein n=1 Tax=Paraburkholderia aspalathi TaxID=1324617 RepID=UPI003C941603
MTSPTSVPILPPADWQQLERLTRAVFSELFNANFSRYGRSGQRQYGIDVLGRRSTGAVIGVQCKGRSSGPGKQLTTKEIDRVIKEAESFPDQLDEFYIITTAPENQVLQQYVFNLSGARKAAGNFPVILWSWQSMEDQIRSCPRVLSTYYGQWWRKPSLKYVAAAVLFTTAIGATGFVGSSRVEQWFKLRDASRDTTVAGLQQVVSTLDELQTAYGHCVDSMAGKAFIYSSGLHTSCTMPIEASLKKLDQQRDQMAGVMNAEAYGEVKTASEYLNEDFRQLLVASDMAKGLEKSAVSLAKTTCPNVRYRTEDSKDQGKLLRKTGESALAEQMAQYFRMRDFALPAIGAMKARLSVASRIQNGQDVPRDLVQEANSLGSLLQEERNFVYKLPAQPFATARIKEASFRTLTVSGESFDPVDEAVWDQTAETAIFEGLRGNVGDVEFLISCGVLKPAARELEHETSKSSTS